MKNRRLTWIRVVAIAGFFLHSLSYLYFFVDDEGIPYVYAQNLLDGRGLVYSPADGPVEGFSDFLHVMLGTGILAITRTLHLPPLAVFPLGKAFSLMAGCGVLWIGGLILERIRITDPTVHVGALAFLALSGPLAVWSCSSLEAVPFALGLAVLVYSLVGDEVRRAPASLSTVFLILERSDGFLWAGAIAGAFWLLKNGEGRRAVTRSVVLPALAAIGVFEAFRLVYYQAWLPMPVYAKVLYKVYENGELVQKRPEEQYALQFIRAYGPWPAAAAAFLSIVAAVRHRALRPLLLAVVLLAGYASLVGDWMFGFRFFVPLLAPAAALLATSYSGVARPLAWAIAIAIVLQGGVAARRFEQSYRTQRNEIPRENFWRVRSLAPEHFFHPEYDLLQMLKPLVRARQRVSYNQAGLIPFALNLDNIDTLGICSRYYAELPARDVTYTEVGRYEPFTEAPIVTARGAYLLNQKPSLIIDSTIPLQRANGGVLPLTILAGHYTLLGVDRSGLKAVYRPTDRSVDEYRRSPDSFLINLAHVSYVQRATAGTRLLTDSRINPELPFLRGLEWLHPVNGNYGWTVALSDSTAIAQYLYIGAVRSDRPGVLHVTLRAPDGRSVLRDDVAVDSRYRMWFKPLSPPAAVKEVELDLQMNDPERQRFYLADVRLMGQTPELRAFVSSQVRFDRSR